MELKRKAGARFSRSGGLYAVHRESYWGSFNTWLNSMHRDPDITLEEEEIEAVKN